MRIGEDCPSALWRHTTRGFHLSGKWLYRAMLDAERGDCQVSVPLPTSEVIRVRDALSLSPIDKEASTSSGLVDVLLTIGRERQRFMESLRDALLSGDDAEALERARELTGLPTKRAPAPFTTQAGS